VYNINTILKEVIQMPSIVYQIDKKTGAKYAFESISYWDKEKKQPRSKRKYLGKVDPETGEIIPSRGRSVHSEKADPQQKDNLSALHKEIMDRDRTIEELNRKVDELTTKYEELLETIQKVRAMVEAY
jgi:predicted RNase H-like nuclease (RuvC/YqgF family)